MPSLSVPIHNMPSWSRQSEVIQLERVSYTHLATKMALNILKNEKTTKGSMNLKRLQAGWDETYLSQLFRDNNF